MLNNFYNLKDQKEIKTICKDNKYAQFLLEFLNKQKADLDDNSIKSLGRQFMSDYPIKDFEENKDLGAYFLCLSLLKDCSGELQSLLTDIMLACEEYEHRVLQGLSKESVSRLLA